MADVRLRPRYGHDAPRRAASGGWQLTTESEWIVEGPAGALTEIAEALPEFAERLGDEVLLLGFRNTVGRYDVPHLGTLDLRSGKWSADDFDAMLRELTEVAAALPFSAREASGLPYERTQAPERAVPYHAFVYLRYILAPPPSAAVPLADQLEPAVGHLLAQPHQRLVADARLVPIDSARNVGARGLLRLLESPWTWTPAAPTTALAAALGGHLPQYVEEDQRRHTHDTAENRFVLAFLELADAIIERTRATASTWPAAAASAAWRRKRVLDDCYCMRQTLDPLRRHPLWDDVGPMVHFPAGSTVLQRRCGYREVLRHHVRLRMASRIPLRDDAVEDLLALKDIATLYEIWAFYALVAALTELLGPPARADAPRLDDDTQLTVPWDLRILWPDQTELIYNARFSRSRAPERRTTSVPLRPDIALRIPAGPARGLHLFDAKFRLQALPSLDDEDDDDTTFKRADLYKMHTYRDAIPDARSVRILYPGDREVFYAANPDDRLCHDGVGAVPLAPRSTHGLDRTISTMLAVPARGHRV